MDYATMQSILGWAAIAAALIAGGIVGAMLVYDLGKPLWRRLARLWRRSPVECVAAVSLLCYCVAWGGGKITFPRTNAEYELLKDAGSYATNDTLHVAYTAHAILPDTADLQVYRRAADSTNDADWAAAWASTVGASPSPFDLDIEGATNWNYAVFTTWQPAPPVQTNGVLHVDWVVATNAETAAASTHALAAVPVKTTVVAGQVNFASGVVETVTETLAPQHARTTKTQTEEEYYYAKYAPDTAILVDLDAADTNTVWVVSACFNRGSEAYTVDWGDGTVTAHTSSYWGTKAGHTYAERGQYVVRLSDSLSQPLYHYGITISPALSRLLRWGDHVTHADYAFGWARTAPIGLPGGEMARWPSNLTSANGTYCGCKSLTGSIPAWPTNSVFASANSTYQNCTLLTGSIPAWPTNLTSANWTYYGCTSLTGSIPAWPTNLTSAQSTYENCAGLTGQIPAWPTNLTSAQSTYAGCSGLTGQIRAWPTNLTSANYTYYGCSGLTGQIPAWPTNLTIAACTYAGCKSLTGQIPAWPTNLTRANATYQYCSGLTGKIPAWPTNLTSANWTYCGCKSLTGAWTDDPDELMPAHITSHNNTVLWASDALRALFYESWEGTRKEGE